jgi:hypothetical protein
MDLAALLLTFQKKRITIFYDRLKISKIFCLFTFASSPEILESQSPRIKTTARPKIALFENPTKLQKSWLRVIYWMCKMVQHSVFSPFCAGL